VGGRAGGFVPMQYPFIHAVPNGQGGASTPQTCAFGSPINPSDRRRKTTSPNERLIAISKSTMERHIEEAISLLEPFNIVFGPQWEDLVAYAHQGHID
jgi:hypothetical protein